MFESEFRIMKITEFLKQYANNMYEYDDDLYMFLEDVLNCQFCPFYKHCCDKNIFDNSNVNCVGVLKELLEE